MRIEIRDVAAVQAIRPVDAALYLRARGWTAPQVEVGRAAIWKTTSNGDEYEALLPLDVGLRDYALRMGDLLATLSIAEKRSQWAVYRDLLTIGSDVTRIRIADPELADGTLPIEEHAQIAQKARDLVLAAACAATETRPVWHKRKPSQAMEHMRRVRIGQSEQGSYVVTVLSRVPPFLHDEKSQLFDPEPPFERRVTETLAQSLAALERAAENAALTQEMAAFDEAVPRGVNANLCDAVVGLWGGDESRRHLEFSFSWSATRPAAADAVRAVAISADRIPLIREAGRQMRDRAPLLDFDLSGPIVKLERAEGAATGKVTVVGIVDDRHAKVSVELPDADYHAAVAAHGQGKTLRLSGTLAKEGRGYVLRNLSDMLVEDE
ncbi:MAG TPA: hypothetical protein VJ783_13780 [Pirellulales bacterium]|nr:hypothetical protein [Pirellulales bacterium]